MKQQMITIPKTEFESLKLKAEINEDLLFKLVRGLEDIRLGRFKPWKRFNSD